MERYSGAMAGTAVEKRCVGRFRIDSLRVITEEAAETLGKPKGNYLTVECGAVTRLDAEDVELLERLLAGVRKY